GLVGADAVLAPFAVGEFRGDEQLPLVADLHHLEGFGPAIDHAPDGELRGLTAAVGAIKLLTVDESSLVVAHHYIGIGWRCSVALLNDLVLQATWGDFHAFLLGIRGQEVFARLLVVRG